MKEIKKSLTPAEENVFNKKQAFKEGVGDNTIRLENALQADDNSPRSDKKSMVIEQQDVIKK